MLTPTGRFNPAELCHEHEVTSPRIVEPHVVCQLQS
jgi:hypothetical protein